MRANRISCSPGTNSRRGDEGDPRPARHRESVSHALRRIRDQFGIQCRPPGDAAVSGSRDEDRRRNGQPRDEGIAPKCETCRRRAAAGMISRRGTRDLYCLSVFVLVRT